MIIILDNGHGNNTEGKRSPIWKDGTQLFEYEFNRDIVKRIKNKLDKNNIQSFILVPELEDISLSERCKRVNKFCKKNKNCILISIHANAFNGTANGWECYTSIGDTKADKYASILYEEAKIYFKDKNIRTDYSDNDPDKESSFYILKHTICPAILIENFFMDNESDCKYILSEEGRDNISNMIVSAILKFKNYE